MPATAGFVRIVANSAARNKMQAILILALAHLAPLAMPTGMPRLLVTRCRTGCTAGLLLTTAGVWKTLVALGEARLSGTCRGIHRSIDAQLGLLGWRHNCRRRRLSCDRAGTCTDMLSAAAEGHWAVINRPDLSDSKAYWVIRLVLRWVRSRAQQEVHLAVDFAAGLGSVGPPRGSPAMES